MFAVVISCQSKTFEALFRSEQYAFMDNACREYCFITEFFMAGGSGAQDMFNLIFSRTMQLLTVSFKFSNFKLELKIRLPFQKNFDMSVSESYDCISLFLCIHLVHKYRLLCHKHAVPALDKYWDTLFAILWPRLDRVMQMNIQSVRECDPQRMKTVDMRPHYVRLF